MIRTAESDIQKNDGSKSEIANDNEHGFQIESINDYKENKITRPRGRPRGQKNPAHGQNIEIPCIHFDDSDHKIVDNSGDQIMNDSDNKIVDEPKQVGVKRQKSDKLPSRKGRKTKKIVTSSGDDDDEFLPSKMYRKRTKKGSERTIQKKKQLTIDGPPDSDSEPDDRPSSSSQLVENRLSRDHPIKFYDVNKEHNQFSLCEAHTFSAEMMEPPFSVIMSNSVLAYMDLHAHCLPANEIIGCLGGQFCSITKTLYILACEPDTSTSAVNGAIHCEMDPLSEMEAVQKFESKGLKFVGWYHSHPIFSSMPSVRDVDTQYFYQKSHEDAEYTPFVAFIVAPYQKPSPIDQNGSALQANNSFSRIRAMAPKPEGKKFFVNDMVYEYRPKETDGQFFKFSPEINKTLASHIQCFWVGEKKYSKGPDATCEYRIPYQLVPKLRPDHNLVPAITFPLTQLCRAIRIKFPRGRRSPIVKLFRRFVRLGSLNVNYLEKINASLGYHLNNNLVSETDLNRILEECASILVNEFN